jgi:hypothetical protein
LRSYTVYLDLWVADREGRVVATGRPELYPHAIGLDVSGSEWFQQANHTYSGDDFWVCDIDTNPTLGNAAVATYSTAVRRGGEINGERLGALGIFFDWAPQAAAVLDGIGLAAEEREKSRLMILNAQHRVIAASDGKGLLSEIYPLDANKAASGYYRKDDRLVAFAETPGYETYRGLGWLGCIESRGNAA